MFSFFLLLVGLAASFASPVLHEERDVGGRIVGGRNGDVEEVPWQVSFLLDGNHNCGGSIISDFFIVSAAHCFRRAIDRYTVRVGSSVRNSGGTVHAVEQYINHPLYGTPTVYSNDINLVKVVEPFVFSARVQPIPLAAQSSEVAPGTWSTISGFGRLWLQGPAPHYLQIAQVPVVSMQQCRDAYAPTQITDDMLCAGLQWGEVDSCSGDSGGPLVVDGVLVGVVAWGHRCAWPHYPGVYADVGYFRNWVAANSGI